MAINIEKTLGFSLYERSAQIYDVGTNFWVGQEYLWKSGWEPRLTNDKKWVYIVDNDEAVLLPPLPANRSSNREIIDPPQFEYVWSDFSNYAPNYPYKKFLDYEYLYLVKEVQERSGRKWSTFRKNARKFSARYPDINRLAYLDVEEYRKKTSLDQLNDNLYSLLESWLEFKNEPIHDAEVLVKFIFEARSQKSQGVEREVLVDVKEDIIWGINIWEKYLERTGKTYPYVFYRYCICRPENFLSEYMRSLFYDNLVYYPYIQYVIDGGVLDNPALKSFKDKMNPHRVRNVYSWYQKNPDKEKDDEKS